jgi:zinc protease
MFLADQIGSLTSMRGQAADLGSNWICAHDLDFTRHYLEAVDRVTPEEVQSAARRYLVESALSSVSVNPKGSLNGAAVSVASHRPQEIRRHVFENGLTLLVREDSRLPLVSLHASLRGGLLAETPATNGLNRLLSRTIYKGAGSRSAEEIATCIEDGGGTVGADSGGSSYSVSAGVLRPDLRTGLDVLGDMLLAPWFPADVVAAEKERQIAAIKAEEDHVMSVAFREVRRLVYGRHPFHLSRNGAAESVASLDTEALKSYHAQRAVGGNVVLSIFGDVAFPEIVDLVGAKMASLPHGSRCDARLDVSLADSRGKISDLVRDKRQAVLVVAFPTVDLAHPDRIALDLVDEACSDMASRMFNRIREELGLAYSVGASQILGMAPGAFLFYLSTAPERLDQAQEELLSQIAKLSAEGFGGEEIHRARKSWAGKQAMQHQSNAAMAQQAAVDELYGFGFNHQQQQLRAVEALSTAAVNAVAAKYFSIRPAIARVHP